ncbi:MAG: TonB family protein [Chitinivibrionales bacterium]|nr:TonB family protein [Chitinivibrionales bacterium]
MKTDQTGIFYLHAAGEKPLPSFPKEYRRRFFAMLDRRFVGLWAGCAVVMGGVALGFSLRELPEEASEKEILKIQERYAQLVLNQPKPKREEKEERGPSRSESKPEKEEEPQEEVDREKESFAQKEQRRKRTREDRKARREQISKEVGSAGIFAAITSASGSGGGSSKGASDLLGAADVVSGLEGLSVSGGTFASRNVDPESLSGRRGERTSGIEMEREEVGRAQTRQIAAAGNVNISSEPPKISGDEAQVKTSQACIQRTINYERAKIKRVYETWLKRDPKLGGRIKIRFTIMPDGSVTSALIVQSTTGNTRFDQNVLRYIGRWNFAKCSPDSPLEIELPFVFEGSS